METVKLKPKSGIKLKNPETRLELSAEGEDVVLSTFWRRRIMEGDVEIIESKKVDKTEQVVTKSKSKKETVGGEK
jgi:hypothetical protein